MSSVVQTKADKVDNLEKKPEKCPCGCGKEPHLHDQVKNPGTNIGISQALKENMYPGDTHLDHPWWIGNGSLEAHHLISSSSMKSKEWAEICLLFGYDINEKLNGVMLPSMMDLACHLKMPRHRGGHPKGYNKGFENDLESLSDNIKKYCNNPQDLIDTMREISEDVLNQVADFTLLLNNKGTDLSPNGCGCMGRTSINGTKNKNSYCAINKRNHSHDPDFIKKIQDFNTRFKKSKTIIGLKKELTIGE